MRLSTKSARFLNFIHPYPNLLSVSQAIISNKVRDRGAY